MKFAASLLALICSFNLNAQFRSPELPIPRNPSEIALALEKLNTVGSVLYLAAHPDDENTRMISWLANERKVRTAYLSLTRGDGGQNLIGNEKGPELGLLRTQELLEARKIDGAEQFFTRAKDFGYSKNPEETFEIWGKQQILADVVWVIRKFRPDVIICRFPTTGEGGHGHHTASAILANEAFKLAADPKAFPEQLSGLHSVGLWQPKRVLWNSFSWNRKPNEQFPGEILVNTGTYNALLGMGYGEMAAIARSKHRCQGFGSRLARGEVQEFVKNIMGDSIKSDILEGIDLSWNRVDGANEIAKMIQEAINSFDFKNPEGSVKQLMAIYIRMLNSAYPPPDNSSKYQALPDPYWARIKMEEVKALILACSGIYLDAWTPSKEIVFGDKFEINYEAINRSNIHVKLNDIMVIQGSDTTLNNQLENNKIVTGKFLSSTSFDQITSQPNWLGSAEQKGVYQPNDKDYVQLPEYRKSFYAEFHLITDFGSVRVKKLVRHKEIDPSIGEVYQPLVIAPPITFVLPERTQMLVNGQKQTLKFAVKSLVDSAVATIRLKAPAGVQLNWTESKIGFGKAGELYPMTVEISSNKALNASELIFEADFKDKKYSFTQCTVEYPHISTQTWFPRAALKLSSVDVKGNAGLIGYISGPGDDVAECLQDIGFTVKKLSDEDLQNADLSQFKTIICGIRTYNTNDKMAAIQSRLNKYVENGGTYIVQYQTNNFIGGLKTGMAPMPITIGRERVTKEEAEIKFVDASAPMLNTPNKIGPADFNNWVQERGLYFASEWDASLKPVFEMNDPGEKAQQGSTLVAQFGKGKFIYTGLSFFRQLPAGVPGAYRLLVNMIN